jgi:mono/diheme cytochrome c family protein
MFNRNLLITALLAGLVLTSCFRSSKNPGREYIPDMGRDVAYEGYYKNPGADILPKGMNAQLPPEGSIAASFDIYPHENSTEGYEAAGASFVNEFSFTEEEIAGEGKKLFGIYCAICHGTAGDGQGHLVQIEKYPPPPSYFREDIMALSEGKRYHSVMYGKGLMGSYATQLSHRERWLVLDYVQQLQDEYAAKNSDAEGEGA